MSSCPVHPYAAPSWTAVGAPDGEKGNTYYYRNRGRIVFEGKGTPSDTTKVLRVEKDVMEDGIP